MELDERARALLALLVPRLKDLDPSGRTQRGLIGYKEAHDRLGLPYIGPTYGESLQSQGLADLAEWTKSTHKPAITGMIIDMSSLRPGGGYFSLFGVDENEVWPWLRSQLAASKAFDWNPYLKRSQVPAPLAIDIEPPERRELTVNRIVRDTAVALKVKALHDFVCQSCGEVMTLGDGRRYAEAHHLRPLGGEHRGPDVAENILCLCPWCHVEFDYGVEEWQMHEFRAVNGHEIGAEYLDYHNDVVVPHYRT